ncbi:MAG: VIT1/CCC1 transporter family protein [Actinobacteria bacterium]|nr:VIT1/CCC1 transporter family protein [Actinomycetota bacterium]MBU1945005.1 VIT1/CCC1 transporter family protein [Actinomycetota bacterium]MBU2686659.1 VIT1/CCC1 transporter family protein [Actinomycetota bacterium]
MLRHSAKIGLSFGLTSGVITTLGLMVGLESGTQSKLVVLGGILTIAVADAFSDALGIHMSEESENKHTNREVWEATVFTFLAKFIFAAIFVIPVLTLDLSVAVVVSVILGLAFITLASYYMARQQGAKPWKVIAEHLSITIIVVVATHYVGHFVAVVCG